MSEKFLTPPALADVLPGFAPTYTDIVRFHYADLSEMNIPERAPAGAWDSSGWDGADPNYGTPDMHSALKLAREGWPEGAEKARKLREGITAARPHAPRLVRYDVAGAVPSIARAIAGNPLNMKRLHIADSRKMPTLTLVCDVAVNWSFPASAMLDHAAATAAVADLLEEAGYRCEIIVCGRIKMGAFCAEIACRLKAPQDAANMASIAFGLGHAAWYRRLCFATWQMHNEVRPAGYGLGSRCDLTTSPNSAIFIAPNGQKVGENLTPMQRFIAVCNALRKQGCPGIPAAEDMPA